ncbi:restriction endonuclease subunit S [Streptomyces sp. PBH53]|uniref:restriction endonuclease subunit S n=1 Tax=Streptomyces sp. PBH53 TaxID=1577075 RepID=UPI001AD829A0|nr:restriction endonuclease subunit S [Streptomyces sp. PBH53]
MSDWQQVTFSDLQTPSCSQKTVPPQGGRDGMSAPPHDERAAKVRRGWVRAPLARFLTLNVETVDVEPTRLYPTIGVLNRGRGLLYRDPVAGSSTSYKKLNRILPRMLIYSRLKAFEGAITVTPDDLPESFASQEFPTFAFAPDADPDFFRILTTTQSMWDALQGASKGMGGRRERVKPTDFLNIVMDIPPLPLQKRIVEVLDAVDDQISALNTESEALEGILDSLRSDLPGADQQPISDVLLGIDSGKSIQAGGEASAEDEYRILKLSAVQRGWFKPSEAKTVTEVAAFSPSHVVKNGDLLITRANTPERVGFVAIARNVPEGTFMPDLIWRLRVDESRVRTEYLEHALSSRELRASISGTAGGTSKSMVKINKRGFGTVRVPIPSLPEQGEYVQRCDAVARGIMAIRAEEARLRRVRAGLLLRLLDRTIEIESAELGV